MISHSSSYIWVAILQGYVTADVADAEGLHRLNLSGTKFRQMLRCVTPCVCSHVCARLPAGVLGVRVSPSV